MSKLSPEEAIKILEDMKVDIPVPKAAVTQIKRNIALDMAVDVLSNCSEFPNNWIPCSEKPDSRGVYRVTVQCEHVDGYPDYEVCYGEYDEENGWFLLDEPVGRINMVAWMRIDYVEPYQPEEESE